MHRSDGGTIRKATNWDPVKQQLPGSGRTGGTVAQPARDSYHPAVTEVVKYMSCSSKFTRTEKCQSIMKMTMLKTKSCV